MGILNSGSLALAAMLSQVVGLAAPVPTPSPLGGLREIGRVRATTVFCKQAVQQANGTISIVLENDTRVGEAVAYMRHTNLDGSVLDRSRGKEQLERQFVALRQAATQGIEQAKTLRKEAENAPTAEQKAQLKSFADALGGALSRQRKIADRIGGFVAYLDAHEPQTEDERKALGATRPAEMPVPAYIEPPFEHKPLTLDQATAAYADLLQSAQEPISRDEVTAQDHLDGAFVGC